MSEVASEIARVETPGLHKALSQRQLRMIAIGGVIGAGLFVGSGVVMGGTGPGAFITYALSGVLIIMVMRMLAEMAVANPSTGSFADYSRDALGHWAGFSVGWLYWYFWVIVVGFEAIAGAKIVQYWLDVPLWLCALAFMVLMTATNLFSVKSYGEFEFWFAGIKVAAIVVFIAIGALLRAGAVAEQVGRLLQSVESRRVHADGLRRDHGRHRHGDLLDGRPGDRDDRGGRIRGSREGGDEGGQLRDLEDPDLLRVLGVPARDNPAVERRGTFRLALRRRVHRDGDPLRRPHHECRRADGGAVLPELGHVHRVAHAVRPRRPQRGAFEVGPDLSPRGVPVNAILFSSIVGFACVIAAAFSEKTIFAFLLNSSGAIILFVYILIAISQIVLRYRNKDAELRLKMWLFPALSILTTVGMVAILVQMGLDASLRLQLLLSLLSWAVVLGLFFLNKRFNTSHHIDADAAEARARVLLERESGRRRRRDARPGSVEA